MQTNPAEDGNRLLDALILLRWLRLRGYVVSQKMEGQDMFDTQITATRDTQITA